MNLLPLTNQPDKLAMIDPDMYAYLSGYLWHLTNLGYCARYDCAQGAKQMVYMHRQVLDVHDGSGPHLYVDHINGNRADNRRSNLRLATKAENMRNRGRTKANTSGFKGVSYHAQSSKWRAYIKTNYKQLYLGLFEDPREAAKAYNEAALMLHGDFACLNPV